MLQRKITNRIEEFYKNNRNKALMIIGARQVGKSYIIEQFASAHYKSVIKMDFIENPDYISLFENAQGADEILLRIFQCKRRAHLRELDLLLAEFHLARHFPLLVCVMSRAAHDTDVSPQFLRRSPEDKGDVRDGEV